MNRIYALPAGLALLLPALTATANPACERRVNNTVAKLTECVTLDGVRAHQAALQSIADANNGHRVAGSDGDAASIDYIASQLEAAGYVVTRQEFQFQTFFQRALATLDQIVPAPAGSIANTIMSYSGNGDVTAPVSIPNLSTGCNAADFAGFPAGNIALIERGICTFALKATNAYSAGASGVVIYNNSPLGPINGTLGTGFALDIPVTSVTQADGQQLAATPGLQLRLKVDAFRGLATSENVLAETATGNADRVVVVGAHLDSVNAGPGNNDNGSGVAAVLETARKMARVRPRNKVRFAFWGNHESGLVGSNFYLSSLSAEDQARIALYLDFHMLGSPNHVFFVYDGDNSDAIGAGPGPAGSDAIEQAFQAFYDSRGLPHKGTDLSGRSDYVAFATAGIPVGGLFTGAEGIKTVDEAALWGGTAGIAYDPCFHQACDTYDNVNLDTLDVNSDAVAATTLHFATSK
jgi:Zn-dependent M28 family amino/carboxypeptidase